MIIRKLQEQDIPQVAVLEASNFSQPWSEMAFRDLLENANALYLVAVEENQVVGVCGVQDMLGEGEIYNVSVKDGRKGEGIATAMLMELMERARLEHGISAFTLEVRVSNQAAIHLYEKLGFISEGIRKNLYERPREDAMIMWKR